jgi:RNA ligase (TIGR02306 family)
MATFEAKVYKLKIEPHPNADKLELAAVGDYRAVVGKGLYKTGDLGVYVQEGSLVPKWLCEKYDWKLAGPDANRVKAIKLRGILSQGIVVPLTSPIGGYGYSLLARKEGDEAILCKEGDDVAEQLGIVKYEPPIPVHMAGEVFNAHGYTLNYDIENIKKYPDILQEGEEVVMTEKLHGTWTCLGWHPVPGYVITSKGLSGQGLAFKLNEANKDNLYLRSLASTASDDGEDIIDRYFGDSNARTDGFYILGETFGKGVQDLHYGTTKPEFRVFDIYIGEPGQGRYLNFDELHDMCKELNVNMVPVLYRGPFSKEKLNEMTNGKETLSGKEANIREGIVVKPVVERRHPDIGRVQLKSVSEAYLLRKGDVSELT